MSSQVCGPSLTRACPTGRGGSTTNSLRCWSETGANQSPSWAAGGSRGGRADELGALAPKGDLLRDLDLRLSRRCGIQANSSKRTYSGFAHRDTPTQGHSVKRSSFSGFAHRDTPTQGHSVKRSSFSGFAHRDTPTQGHSVKRSSLVTILRQYANAEKKLS